MLKCKYRQTVLKLLDYIINGQRIKLTEEKLLAIKNLFPLIPQYNNYEVLYVQKITFVDLFKNLVNCRILLQNRLKKNLNLKINYSVVKLDKKSYLTLLNLKLGINPVHLALMNTQK